MTVSRFAPWCGLLVGLALVASSTPAHARLRPVGPAIRLSHVGQPRDYERGAALPAMAADPVSGRVLAVWGIGSGAPPADVLFGRMLGATGRPVGFPFSLWGFEAGFNDDAVAPRGPGGGFVVASAMQRDFTCFCAGPALLTTVDPSGHQGPVRNLSGAVLPAGGGARSVALTVDPVSGRGVVGWVGEQTKSTSRQGLGVYLQALDGGRPTGPVRHVRTGPPGARNDIDGIGLAYRPRSRRFLAVWDQVSRISGRHHLTVTAQAISLHGRLLSRRRMAISRHDFRGDRATRPTVLPDDTGSGTSVFLSTSGHGDYATSRVQLLRLGRRGSAHARLRIVGTDPGADHQSAIPVVAAGAPGDPAVLAYSQTCLPFAFGCPEFTPVVGQEVGSAAAGLHPSRLISRGASGDNARVALVRTGRGRYLVAARTVVGRSLRCFDDYDLPSENDVNYCQKAEMVVRRFALRP